MGDVKNLMIKKEFLRSARYDIDWILDNQMGPNSLWLMEWLAGSLPFKSGMRILDLGCGKALSSIFMAIEYEVDVWAADLWIRPDNNLKRVQKAGVGNRVFPLCLEAHALPFAEQFFDIIVSIDAYQYFGTDVLYINYLSRFIKPGGFIGIVVPAMMKPIKTIPDHLREPQLNGKVFWEDDCWSFKTAEWWKEHWSRCPSVNNIRVDVLEEGWRHWRDFEEALQIAGKSIFPSDAEALHKDQGEYIGFVRAIAEKNGFIAENLYDSELGIKHGIDK